jgi:hypothetical protein
MREGTSKTLGATVDGEPAGPSSSGSESENSNWPSTYKGRVSAKKKQAQENALEQGVGGELPCLRPLK